MECGRQLIRQKTRKNPERKTSRGFERDDALGPETFRIRVLANSLPGRFRSKRSRCCAILRKTLSAYLDYSFAVPLCQEAADLSHNYAVQNIVDKFLISSYDMHNFITSGLA